MVGSPEDTLNHSEYTTEHSGTVVSPEKAWRIPIESAMSPVGSITPMSCPSEKRTPLKGTAAPTEKSVAPIDATALSPTASQKPPETTATPSKSVAPEDTLTPTQNITSSLEIATKPKTIVSKNPDDAAVPLEEGTPPKVTVTSTYIYLTSPETMATPKTHKTAGNVVTHPDDPHPVKNTASPSDKTKKSNKKEGVQDDDITVTQPEIDIVWEKLEELTAAIATQDSVLQEMIERCQNMEIKINNLTPEDYVLKAEKSFDIKLTAFTSLLNSEYEKKLSLISKDIFSRINTVHSKMGKLTEDIQRRPTPCPENGELKQELDKISKELELKGIDYINNSLKVTEEKLKDSISSVDDKLKIAKSEIAKNSTNLKKIEGGLKNLQIKLTDISKINTDNTHKSTPVENRPSENIRSENRLNEDRPSENRHRNSTELLLCFDSNVKFIDRKRLWKIKNSELVRCGQLHEVTKVFESDQFTSLKYLLLNVGVNDLDGKDSSQVFGELESLIDQIRSKHPGIKFIISEITPRNDERDDQVKLCNILLKEYARNHPDVTLAIHQNLRDPEWSMFSDEKHISKFKIGRFAANLIKALKIAYGISDKSELFEKPLPGSHQGPPYHRGEYSGHHRNQPSHQAHQPLMSVNIPYNDNGQFSKTFPTHSKSIGTPHSLGSRLRHLAEYPVQGNENNHNPQIHNIRQEFEDFMRRVLR